MASTENNTDIPDELVDKLLNFQQSFEKMIEILEPLNNININSSDNQLDPLDRARLNLVSGFALNSMFWMYLKTLGVDPQEHKIKGELERYKYYFSQIKEIADKDKAPVLDKAAAGRFIRSALWEPKDPESQEGISNSSETENYNSSTTKESGMNVKRERESDMKVKQERESTTHRENFGKNKRWRH